MAGVRVRSNVDLLDLGGCAFDFKIALIDAKRPVPEVFRTLHDRLTARYPSICSLPEEDVDEYME